MANDTSTPMHTPPVGELEPSTFTKTEAKGRVRIRSNVCNDPKAWHLVPGDELRRHGLHYGGVNEKQHKEMMYYEPCAYCRRRIFEIREDGCDDHRCQTRGKTISTAEAARRKSKYVEKP